jgi:hypothetical protein
MFELGKVQRTIVAAIGALIFTGAAVSAAVGPARAVETAPVVLAQATVQANG